MSKKNSISDKSKKTSRKKAAEIKKLNTEVMSTENEDTELEGAEFTESEATDLMEAEAEDEEYSENDFSDELYDQTDNCSFDNETSLSLYLKDISKIPILSEEEERDLAYKAAAGDQYAKDQLITHNTRLVVSIAKKYARKISDTSTGQGRLLLEDLIGAGNIGLMNGIDRFDVSKGYRVSTYVSHWIFQAVFKSLAEYGRAIHIPNNTILQLNKLKKETGRLTMELGREPDTKELSEAMGLNEIEVEELIALPTAGLFLDVPIGDEDETCMVDMVEDTKITSVEDQVENSMMHEELMNMIASLPPRERAVIMYRFGFADGEEYTLEALGEKFNVSRERIRQIERTGINRLRQKAERRMAG